MNVLGLNVYHGDASAALVMDGQLVATAEEERFRERHNRYSQEDADHELTYSGDTLQPARFFSTDPLLRRAALKQLT